MVLTPTRFLLLETGFFVLRAGWQSGKELTRVILCANPLRDAARRDAGCASNPEKKKRFPRWSESALIFKGIMGKMNQSFSPIDAFNRILNSWWWVFLFMLLGGAVGFGFHAIHPPVYEATTKISFNIDYTHSGQLSDVEEDQMLGVAGDVIGSTAVLEKVVSAAQAGGISIDLPALKQSIFRERKAYIWVMRVRQGTPQQAAALAGLWGDAAYAALNDGRSHSQNAELLQRNLDGLVSCMQQAVSALPAQSLCSQDLPVIQSGIKQVGARLQAEKMAGQGVSPALEFTQPDNSGEQSSPVIYGRNQVMLAAAVIGFILGIWSVYLGFPERLARSRRAA
jgi:capsular polysaccharide biosynthesis protein